jgi:hypothetical protein
MVYKRNNYSCLIGIKPKVGKPVDFATDSSRTAPFIRTTYKNVPTLHIVTF